MGTLRRLRIQISITAFLGVGLAWQVAFLVIAGDPVRFRPMMAPATLEKFIYVISLSVLYVEGCLHSGQLVGVGPDLVLGVLFIVAFLKTSGRGSISPSRSDDPGIC